MTWEAAGVCKFTYFSFRECSGETIWFWKADYAGRNESESAMQTTELPTVSAATEACPLCGTELPRGAAECTRCDWVRPKPDPVHKKANPRDTAAACLSVIPGAGHFFKGYTSLAILFFAGVPVILLLAITFTMFLGWLMVPVYWLAVATDAYIRKDIRPPTPGSPIRK